MRATATRKETRKFGTAALIFFGVLCGVSIWREREILVGFFGLAAVLGAGMAAFPGPLAPLHAGWLRVAHFVGTVITGVLMSVAYYVVITPAGLIKRMAGGRPLPMRPDRSVSTYWVDRDEAAQPKERFAKRY